MMLDDVTDIAQYYNDRPDYENERLDRHQLEFDMTWRFFDQYLPKSGSILEVGAATGKYTLGLAKRGYDVTAVDMSDQLLAVCQKRSIAAGLEHKVQTVVADARDLSLVQKKDFDAVLLMGPLYHLTQFADRNLALQQVFDRMAPQALLFTAFISRVGIMGDLLKNYPEWIENQEDVRAHLDHGQRPAPSPKGGFRGYFATVPEIAPLHESIGFETIAVAGIEPGISDDDESYNKLEGKQRELWLDLFYEMSTDASLVGASRHLLYVGRKPSN